MIASSPFVAPLSTLVASACTSLSYKIEIGFTLGDEEYCTILYLPHTCNPFKIIIHPPLCFVLYRASISIGHTCPIRRGIEEWSLCSPFFNRAFSSGIKNFFCNIVTNLKHNNNILIVISYSKMNLKEQC